MEVYEEEQSKREVKGLTDRISRGSVTEVTYPVININLTDLTPKYKLKALSKLLSERVPDGYSENVTDMAVSVSLKTANQYKPIGVVMPSQIKTLMFILTGIDLELEMEKGDIRDSKYIYALSL